MTSGNPLRFYLTWVQTSFMAVLTVLILVVSLFPTFGAPHFRYTGSDPNRDVWNLGFPLAVVIYDPAMPPHVFYGPEAFVVVMIFAFGYPAMCFVCFAFNNRLSIEHLRRSLDWSFRITSTYLGKVAEKTWQVLNE